MPISAREYHPAAPGRQSFWRSIGVPARGDELYQALHEGLSVSVLDHLSKATGLNKKALGLYVSIPPATLQRRLKSKRFSTEESDRLFRLAQLVHAALELFEGDEEATQRWLASPIRGLGNHKPIEMLKTSAETTAVLDLIGRLEHGVTA